MKPYVAIILLAVLVTVFGFLGVFSAGFFAGLRVAFYLAIRVGIVLLLLFLALLYVLQRRKASGS